MNRQAKYKVGFSILFVALLFLFPLKSLAHNAYYLQTLIDDHQFQYQGNVLEDNASFFSSEGKHLEKELGKFGGLDEGVISSTDVESYKDNGLNDDSMPFTFQPKENKDGWFGQNNHATREDVDKAYLIQQTLMPGLNDTLKILNNGKSFESIEELMKMSNKLSKALATKIPKGSKTGSTPVTIGKYSITRIADEVTIVGIKENEGEKYEFVYKVEKGYKDAGFPDDTEFITWNQLMYHANYAYAVEGYTVKNGNELAKPNKLEEWIVDMFDSLYNQLRNILGLYDTNELAFNKGIRGSSAYESGVMSNDWWEKVQGFHVVFQLMAWSLITLAIVKALISRNLATINPSARVSLIESIQNLMITGVLLSFAYPVIQMFLTLNFKIVAMFATTAPDYGAILGLNNYTGFLGGVLLQFFYLFIAIYLNFIYIMRAIILAILIATAPLFIVTIAFGGKWQSLFQQWLRELIGNIFLQSFHAFILSFFFVIQTSSRGIESAIICFALIPMTEFFRGMVMGQGGGLAHNLGSNALSQATGMATNAVSGFKGKGNIGTQKSKDTSKTPEGSSKQSEAQANNVGMNDMAGRSDKIKNNAQNAKSSANMRNTASRKNSNEGFSKPTSNGSGFDSNSMNLNKSEEKFDLKKTAKEGLNSPLGKGLIKGAGVGAKVGLGAVKVGAGLGASLALGSIDPNIAKSGAQMASQGFKDIAKEGKSGVKAVKSATVSSANAVNNKIVDNKTLAKTKEQLDNTGAKSRQLPNGDREVQRSMNEFEERGVEKIVNNRVGQLSMTYDESKMDAKDKANLEQAKNAFKPTAPPELKEYYKKQGIDGVYNTKSGNTAVLYNKEGVNNLGLKSISNNKGVVTETKTKKQPINPKVTLNIPPMKQKPDGDKA